MSGSGGSDQFAKIAGAVARVLWGDENKSLSSKDELRFGRKGSISVDLKKGTIFDHSNEEGGGVLWAIEKNIGLKGGEAIDWLRQQGFDIEERRGGSSNRDYGPADRGDQRQEAPWRIVRTWDYVDERGELIFQVVRQENGEQLDDGKPKKKYLQRQPDGRGGWNWKTAGIRQVPYRLPDLIEAVKNNVIIFVTEGEKAADRLLDMGIPATTNARGAKKWVEELNMHFKGARVVILPDNDEVGREHADLVGRNLEGIARDIRVLNLPGIPQKGDVVEWLDAGGQLEDLYDLARTAPRFEAAPYQSRFNAITWQQLDDPGPQHEWLVKGLLTRGETSIIGGASQAGKSFLIIDVGMAVARGIDWFGRKTRQGLVIYQAGEGAKGVKKRLKAYRIRQGLSTSDPLPFVLMPAQLNLYRDDDQTNAFIEEAQHWSTRYGMPIELIVIDTFAKAMTGANENDGRDVGQVLERCSRISSATGAHVALVHHMNAEGSKLRGHTSILANLENVLIVSQAEGLRDEDQRQIREVLVDKQKDGERGSKIRFVLGSVEIGKDEDDDPITSCVVLSPKGDGSDQPAPERASVTDGEAVFLRAVERAVSEHGDKPPLASGLPQSLRIVEWKRFVQVYDSMAFDAADEEKETDEDRAKRLNARRQTLKRIGEKLMTKGIIAKEAPWIWLTGKRVKGFRSMGASPPPVDPPAPPYEGERRGLPMQGQDDALPELWGD